MAGGRSLTMPPFAAIHSVFLVAIVLNQALHHWLPAASQFDCIGQLTRGWKSNHFELFMIALPLLLVRNCRTRAGSVVRISCALFWLTVTVSAQNAATNASANRIFAETVSNISLRNEAQHALDKGLVWLNRNQDSNGYWSTPDHPAITALALSAIELSNRQTTNHGEPGVQKGFDYLLGCVQPNGGIYRKELASYNTSIALVALAVANRPEYRSAMIRARRFMVGLQADFGEAGKLDNVLDGGFGYGVTNKTPDLCNTEQALEALYVTRNLDRDGKLSGDGTKDLNWEAAIHFIQSCQNLPSHNQEAWVSGDPQNKGGFVYAPGSSKAGETNVAPGRVALRSSGSMSYAGLLSYIYAELKTDDPRVAAVMEWLQANYTLAENPALGPQGLYYYYHTMSKALTFYGADTLTLRDGRKVKWREELVLKLINLQHTDGSWANENGRWFEKDPALVTAYALLTLEMIEERL